MEVVIGLKHLFEKDKLFWLVGLVREVGPHELLLEHFDGSFLKVELSEIQIINWYSHEYFTRRNLKDPKEELIKKQQQEGI